MSEVLKAVLTDKTKRSSSAGKVAAAKTASDFTPWGWTKTGSVE